ncbi:MAG: hypothetical protein E7333_09115 [Clostridiales bacterium]|nr:hypothetical protein [Clostridiales bacterium]
MFKFIQLLTCGLLCISMCGCDKIPEISDEISQLQPTDAVVSTVPPEQKQAAVTETPVMQAPAVLDVQPHIDVAFAPEDYVLRPQDFEVHHFVQTEYGADVMFTPRGEVRNFRYFAFDNERLFNYNEFIIVEVLFTAPVLTQDKPFVTRIYIEGYGGPYHGISYEDAAGIYHEYIIYESGEDGHYYLADF